MDGRGLRSAYERDRRGLACLASRRSDFGSVAIFAVVAPSHALAGHAGSIPTMVLRDSLADHQSLGRAGGRGARRFGQFLAHLARQRHSVRRSPCCAGVLGWGYLPRHIAEPDIAAGMLVQLSPATRSNAAFQPWSYPLPRGEAARTSRPVPGRTGSSNTWPIRNFLIIRIAPVPLIAGADGS